VILSSSSNLVGLEELEFEWGWCCQVLLCHNATFIYFPFFPLFAIVVGNVLPIVCNLDNTNKKKKKPPPTSPYLQQKKPIRAKASNGDPIFPNLELSFRGWWQ
jgi:hypothetical protein